MIDEIEIKQQLMLLEAEYNYLWSHSYSKTNPPFGSKRSAGFTEVKHMIRYYKKLETHIQEIRSLQSSINALECIKANTEFKLISVEKMSELEKYNYIKLCEDLNRLQKRLEVVEQNLVM